MSIRSRLLVGLLLGLAAIACLSGGFLYFYMLAVLRGQFDAALSARAGAICSLIKQQPAGEVEIEFSAESMPEFGAAGNSHFFQVLGADGSLLIRSPSLHGRDLAHNSMAGDGPMCWNNTLPNGLPGRSLIMQYAPAEDEPQESGTTAPVAAKPRAAVQVVVAQECTELDRTMRILLSALLMTLALMCAGMVVLSAMTVKNGLRPLDQVADEAARIDAETLNHRFSLIGLPSELVPICTRLNESLGRLEEAFVRERRFTADVAHELRTPIAELRSLGEVAMKCRDDPPSTAEFFNDVREIAQHMEMLVTNMLAVARAQSGSMKLNAENVTIRQLVAEAWRPWRQKAAERGLSAKVDIPESMNLQTDRVLLRCIVSNLLCNAVEYTPIGGTVSCRAEPDGQWIILSVANDNDSLCRDDLPHIFETFWRKDPSRTNAAHSGLGLTVVATYTALLGGKVEAELKKPDSLSVNIYLPFEG